MEIVLASGSPRRKILLEEAGVQFEVHPSAAEELCDFSLPVNELCEENARRKACAVSLPGCAIIGADTLVAIDEKILGKPIDLARARVMLRDLAGRQHLVCTGVCLRLPDKEPIVFHEITKVSFHPFDDQVIDDYFSKVDPLDKAGAYGIQDHGEMLVAAIDGNFDNVMGLPVAAVLRHLGLRNSSGS